MIWSGTSLLSHRPGYWAHAPTHSATAPAFPTYPANAQAAAANPFQSWPFSFGTQPTHAPQTSTQVPAAPRSTSTPQSFKDEDVLHLFFPARKATAPSPGLRATSSQSFVRKNTSHYQSQSSGNRNPLGPQGRPPSFAGASTASQGSGYGSSGSSSGLPPMSSQTSATSRSSTASGQRLVTFPKSSPGGEQAWL